MDYMLIWSARRLYGTIVSGLGGTVLGTSLVMSLLFGAMGCSAGPSESSAKITAFTPASGIYHAGDEAVSSLRFENTGDERRTFWVGYSVRDGAGGWHDAPADSVALKPGEESGGQKRAWSVPEDSLLSGPYKVVMAVWSGPPGEGGTRLAGVSREDTFQIIDFCEDFESLNRERWIVTSKLDKKLGRSYLKPENIGVRNGNLSLKLPAGTLDGGEIKSAKRYRYGSYRARIKVADAPSSITGFFLYREPDFENELDVEVFNSPSGRILFTTYSGGEETNAVEEKLPFDPTEDFHEYRFDFYPDRAEFYVDGELMHGFEEGLPEDPMRLYVNTWFPAWLSGKKLETDSYTYVEWVRH